MTMEINFKTNNNGRKIFHNLKKAELWFASKSGLEYGKNGIYITFNGQFCLVASQNEAKARSQAGSGISDQIKMWFGTNFHKLLWKCATFHMNCRLSWSKMKKALWWSFGRFFQDVLVMIACKWGCQATAKKASKSWQIKKDQARSSKIKQGG